MLSTQGTADVVLCQSGQESCDQNARQCSLMMPAHSRRPTNPPEGVGVSLGDALQVAVHPIHQARSHFGVDAADVVQVRQAETPHCARSNRAVGARPAAWQGLFICIP